MSRCLLILTGLLAVSHGMAAAQMSYGRAPRVAKDPELPEGVGVEQMLGAQIPLDMVFHDHDGKEITLGQCIGGKPTILTLAYFSCPKLCTEVLNGLVGEMGKLTRFSLRAGDQFNVVTVSINPKDAPAFARMKRTSYHEAYDKRPEDRAGWWFLTASRGQGTNLLEAEAKIRKLADIVGYGYSADNFKAYRQAEAETDPVKRAVMLETAIRKTKDYIHPSTVIVLTKDGRISQYFHGLPRGTGTGGSIEEGYNAEDLRLALAKANDGTIGTALQRMAMNCFAYDEQSAVYKLNMGYLRWAAAPFVLLVPGIVYMTWRRARRERATLPAAPQQQAAT